MTSAERYVLAVNDYVHAVDSVECSVGERFIRLSAVGDAMAAVEAEVDDVYDIVIPDAALNLLRGKARVAALVGAVGLLEAEQRGLLV